eukprot:UN17036
MTGHLLFIMISLFNDLDIIIFDVGKNGLDVILFMIPGTDFLDDQLDGLRSDQYMLDSSDSKHRLDMIEDEDIIRSCRTYDDSIRFLTNGQGFDSSGRIQTQFVQTVFWSMVSLVTSSKFRT